MTQLWMHGLGPDPEKGAKHLKEYGFKAVVGGAGSAEAVLSQGMDYYISPERIIKPRKLETADSIKKLKMIV